MKLRPSHLPNGNETHCPQRCSVRNMQTNKLKKLPSLSGPLRGKTGGSKDHTGHVDYPPIVVLCWRVKPSAWCECSTSNSPVFERHISTDNTSLLTANVRCMGPQFHPRRLLQSTSGRCPPPTRYNGARWVSYECHYVSTRPGRSVLSVIFIVSSSPTAPTALLHSFPSHIFPFKRWNINVAQRSNPAS